MIPLNFECGDFRCEHVVTTAATTAEPLFYIQNQKNVLLPNHIAHSNVLSMQRSFTATFFINSSFDPKLVGSGGRKRFRILNFVLNLY